MDQVQLMAAIKTNARTIVTTINRAIEQTDSRVKDLGPSLGTYELSIMNSVLEMVCEAAIELERGANLLGQETSTKRA